MRMTRRIEKLNCKKKENIKNQKRDSRRVQLIISRSCIQLTLAQQRRQPMHTMTFTWNHFSFLFYVSNAAFSAFSLRQPFNLSRDERASHQTWTSISVLYACLNILFYLCFIIDLVPVVSHFWGFFPVIYWNDRIVPFLFYSVAWRCSFCVSFSFWMVLSCAT